MRILAVIGAPLFLVMAVVSLLPEVKFGAARGSLFTLVFLASAVVLVRYAVRSKIELTATHLVVHNALKSYSISLGDIRMMSGGYNGIQIAVAGRRSICAAAVQKSNWNTWRGNHTRADDVVDAVLAAKQALLARETVSVPVGGTAGV
jgi:hypothetical protein